MSSGGQTPVTQQTTQTKDPWSAAQPYLINNMQSAANNYNAGVGYQPYTGQTQAAMDPNLTAGLAGITNIANANIGGTPGVLAAQAQGTNLIQNQGLSPELKSLLQMQQGQNNPYLQNILDTSNRRISDKIGSSMSGAGRYGSGAHTDVAARAMAEASDPILAQDYQARQQMQQQILEGGLQRSGQWSQLMPSLDQAQYAPAQALAGVGDTYTQRAQAQLADQIKLYNAQQAYPWEQLSRMNAIVGGAGALGGTQITSSPIQQPSMLQSALGGGVAGAGLGSIFGAPGAAVGAGAGSLLGLLGR